MKKHSTKAMEKKGIFKNLFSKIFINKKNEKLLFSFWNYNKGIYNFFFINKKDKNKNVLYDDVKTYCIQLYHQYITNYENTLKLIYSCFDKIENIKGE